VNSEKQAPGALTRPLAQIGVLEVPRAKLRDRLVRTKKTTDLGAGSAAYLTTRFTNRGSPQAVVTPW
jgi:hypothetical protein